MKNVLAILLIALTSVTCSTKTGNAPAPVAPTLPCLITKITTTSTLSNNPINKTETFEYGTDNKLANVTVQPASGTPAEITTYTHVNGVITKATFSYNSHTYVATWTVTNGNLIKVDTPGPPEGGIVNFTYEGARVKTRNYKRDSGQEVGNSVTYSSSGNPDSKQYSVTGLPDIGVETYSSFDSKTNPYSLLATSMGLTNYLTYLNGDMITESLGKNNILAYKSSSYTSGSATPSSETNWTYAYEYNAKGNVTKYVKTSNDYIVTVLFEYKNCN